MNVSVYAHNKVSDSNNRNIKVDIFINDVLIHHLHFDNLGAEFTNQELFSSIESPSLRNIIESFLTNEDWRDIIENEIPMKIYEDERNVRVEESIVFIDDNEIPLIDNMFSKSFIDKHHSLNYFQNENNENENKLDIYGEHNEDVLKLTFYRDNALFSIVTFDVKDKSKFLDRIMKMNRYDFTNRINKDSYPYSNNGSLFYTFIVNQYKLLNLVFNNSNKRELIYTGNHNITLNNNTFLVNNNDFFQVDIDNRPFFIAVTDKYSKYDDDKDYANFSMKCDKNIVFSFDDKEKNLNFQLLFPRNMLNILDEDEIVTSPQVEFCENEIHEDGNIIVIAVKEDENVIKLNMMDDDKLLAEFIIEFDEDDINKIDDMNNMLSSPGEFCQNGYGAGSFNFSLNTNNLKHIAHPDFPFDEEKLIYRKSHTVEYKYLEEKDEESETHIEKIEILLDNNVLCDLWMQRFDVLHNNGNVQSSFYEGGGCATDTNGLIEFNEVDDNFIIEINDCNSWPIPSQTIKAYFPTSVYHEQLKKDIENIKDNEECEIRVLMTQKKDKRTNYSIFCNDIIIARVVSFNQDEELNYHGSNCQFNVLDELIELDETNEECLRYDEYKEICKKNCKIVINEDEILIDDISLFKFNSLARFDESKRYREYKMKKENVEITVLYPTIV